MIFIYAVEINHGLAPHLVGPDPLVGDQLISFSSSKFAIAATILELDSRRRLLLSLSTMSPCKRFDDPPIRSKPR